MTDAPPRVIADFCDYNGLVAGLRRRVDELGVVIGTLDEVAGLPTRYVSKMLGPRQVRRFSMQSLTPLLWTLGIRLQMVEDEDTKRFIDRLPKRGKGAIRSGTTEIRLSRRFMRKIQAKGRKARFAKMTPNQRSALARKLNRIRWARVRGTEVPARSK
jgi:hypothetical protein